MSPPMSDPTPAISIRGVTKTFGDVVAVDDLSIDIREGEFLTLLGPSGCGKTTTMRMVAGFEEPDEGDIQLRGEDVVGVPPNKRHVNMCFQNYALFPHMDVQQNIEYGLKLKKVGKEDRARKVEEMLGIVRLEGYEHRRPGQLSGGQQQRVALARALVNEPAALLLDEPLGALDVKLRKQMQLELKRIQHELGTTFVYVTHDQDEALAMSDRIAVMNRGRVEQIGGPREIYEHPATAFVADFIGSLNALELTVDEVVGGFAVMRAGEKGRVVLADPSASAGTTLRVAVRPERVRIAAAGAAVDDGGSRLEGTVAQVVYLGMYTQFHVDTPAGIVVASRLADELASPFEVGRSVSVSWEAEHTSLLSDAVPQLVSL
jgi:spermidine/putrescine transport system ATP-binding protein